MFLLNLFLDNPIQGIAWVVGFLIALSVHEAAHALAASYLGDPTAKFAGRITLNPAAHIDPVGVIMLLLIGFGWGKPVPVNPSNFTNRRAGEILTSLAGPISNLAVAMIFAIPYNFLTTPGSDAFFFLQMIILVNIVIMVFNLIPIPPLDGGGVVTAILPPEAAYKYSHNGPMIFFALIAVDIIFKLGIFAKIIWPAVHIVFAAVNLATTFGG